MTKDPLRWYRYIHTRISIVQFINIFLWFYSNVISCQRIIWICYTGIQREWQKKERKISVVVHRNWMLCVCHALLPIQWEFSIYTAVVVAEFDCEGMMDRRNNLIKLVAIMESHIIKLIPIMHRNWVRGSQNLRIYELNPLLFQLCVCFFCKALWTLSSGSTYNV